MTGRRERMSFILLYGKILKIQIIPAHDLADIPLATVLTQLDLGTAIPEELYQAIVEGFMEKYPGIKVEQINIPTESEWLNSESVLMSDPSSMPP